jgi:general secretion pathway protein D
VRPSIVGKQGLTSLGVGRVNGDLGFGGLVLSAGSESISVLLRALRQNYQVDILSRPQIRALDNHEALIQIGRQVPVVDGVAITAVGSANPVIRQDQSGIILKVIPQISADGNVLIDVKAEKSAYQLTPGTGVPIFTDATNGNVIEAPVKDITTATTAVSVRTGETIVLGGMITRDEVRLHRKVPFLGDIPLLGQLFQYKLNESKRKELLIFLTPLVIEDSYHAERIKAVEVERMHFPMPIAEEMHGPIFADVMPVEHVEDPSMAPAYPAETGGYAAPQSAPGGTVYGPRYGTVPQPPGPGYSAPAGMENATPQSSPPAETPRPRRKFLGGWAPSARRQR